MRDLCIFKYLCVPFDEFVCVNLCLFSQFVCIFSICARFFNLCMRFLNLYVHYKFVCAWTRMGNRTKITIGILSCAHVKH